MKRFFSFLRIKCVGSKNRARLRGFACSSTADRHRARNLPRSEHDVTYYVKFPEENCREDYIGETERRLPECEIHHSGRDKNSHVLKHCIEKEHKLPSLENFAILGTNYKKNKFRKKNHSISRKNAHH